MERYDELSSNYNPAAASPYGDRLLDVSVPGVVRELEELAENASIEENASERSATPYIGSAEYLG